jgi:hypothetical protein
VNNELKRIWNEAVVVKFKVLFRHFSGGAEGNHKISVVSFAVPAEIVTGNIYFAFIKPTLNALSFTHQFTLFD